MNFDEIIDRRNTHSAKWDAMEPIYGVSADDGLAMWVADMDFRPPQAVTDAVMAMADHGVYGYYADYKDYNDAITGWMQRRHGWDVNPKSIFTTHGLCNAVGLVAHTYTQLGDSVVLMTPVYHAFARVIKAGARQVVECELALRDGRYEMDFKAWEQQMTGREKMLILCSPHNPGGRVWTASELRQMADFCHRHDLLLVSDEIHHDLVYPGSKHQPMPLAAPDILDRLVMLTAPSKTFNIAGLHTGNVIIPDEKLRRPFAATMAAMSISGNTCGLIMSQAAYLYGDKWADALVRYLDGNRKIFDEGLNAIPGVKSMKMEATFLSWVDFSGTGMNREEFTDRVQTQARIAGNHGHTFGKGGENFLRFNIGTPRARIHEAVARLQAAFSDLQ